jgi:hypothetical protein
MYCKEILFLLNEKKRILLIAENLEFDYVPHRTQFGLVAQSVEQRTENPCVAGSIPVQATLGRSIRTSAFFFIFELGVIR